MIEHPFIVGQDVREIATGRLCRVVNVGRGWHGSGSADVQVRSDDTTPPFLDVGWHRAEAFAPLAQTEWTTVTVHMEPTLTRGLAPFDWDTDCGPYVSPTEAVQQSHDAGQSFTTYAEGYVDAWPFGGELTEDEAAIVIAGMVRTMTIAARSFPCAVCG